MYNRNGPDLIHFFTGPLVEVEGVHGLALTSEWAEHDIFGPGIVIPNYEGPHLISLGKLVDTHEMTVERGHDLVFISRQVQGSHLYARKRPDRLYQLEEIDVHSLPRLKAMASLASKRTLVWNLHQLLHHPGSEVMKQLIRTGELKSILLTEKDVDDAGLDDCTACIEGKSKAGKPRNPPSRPRPRIGERLHIDVVFVRLSDRGELTSYLMAIDEMSNYIHLHRLADKRAETINHHLRKIIGWHRQLQSERQQGPTPIGIFSDNEKVLDVAGKGLRDLGVDHEMAAPGVHDKWAERAVQTLRRKAKATLRGLWWASMFPENFLHYLLESLVLGMNQTPNKKTGGWSPQKIVENTDVDGCYFQVPFGTIAYFHRPDAEKKLTSAHGELGIVLGRGKRTRRLLVYRFPDLIDGTPGAIVARDRVLKVVHPGQFPEHAREHLKDYCEGKVITDMSVIQLGDGSKELMSTDLDTDDDPQHLSDAPELPPGAASHLTPTTSSTLHWDHDEPMSNDESMTAGRVHEPEGPATDLPTVDDLRLAEDTQKGPPGETDASIADDTVQDLDGEKVEDGSTLNAASTRTSGETSAPAGLSHRPDVQGVTTARLSRVDAEGVEHRERKRTRTGLRDVSIPDYRKVAGLKSLAMAGAVKALPQAGILAMHCFALAGWAASTELSGARREAITQELQQLHDYEVLAPINLGDVTTGEIRSSLPSVMLISDKIAPDGTFLKIKARFVVKGFHDDIVEERTAPTVSHEVVMIALNGATSHNHSIDIFDVGAAFLEAKVERKILVRIDPELGKTLISKQPSLVSGRLPDGVLVVRLKKALYGLRDAPSCWYKTLEKVLGNLGFRCSDHDKCLFIRKTDEGLHFVLTHVDDMLSTGPQGSMMQFRKELTKAFKKLSTNINPDSFNYLGMHVTRDRSRRTMTLSQRKYIENIIARLQLSENDVSESPHDDSLLEEKGSASLPPHLKTTFASMVMTMMYVSKTRIDIRRTVIHLTTKLANPTQDDWIKMVRIGEYLNGTKEIGGVVRASNMIIAAAADAAFAVHTDRKSHTGGLLWLGESNLPIQVISKKQTLVTTSSTSSELVALERIVKDVRWMRGVLVEMGFAQAEPTVIDQDNRACMILANRGVKNQHSLSKSVDIKYFWLTEKIEEGEIKLRKIDTSDNLADGFTKPLLGKAFKLWRDRVLNLTTDES